MKKLHQSLLPDHFWSWALICLLLNLFANRFLRLWRPFRANLRSNPELKEVEIAFNRLKQTDPSIIPPTVPYKHQITDEDRRREEEELQRVLALSLEESQEDPRYNNFETYNSSSFASSSNNNFNSNSSNTNNNFGGPNIQGSNASQTTNPFTQSQPVNNTQRQQQPPQATPSANLLDLEDNPEPSTPRSASSVRAVRAIYDLTSTEPR